MRASLLLLPVLLLANCASIVEGTDQSVTVITDPTGASCRLNRDEQTIAVVNPTPGSVRVDKSKDHITVLCEKGGYEDGAGTLASEFQGMTFGNIVFGGVIGVGVDAATGAMNEYPPSVTIVLAPESFPSIADRDAFYQRRKADVSARAAEAIANIRNHCASDAAERCDTQVGAIEAERDAELAALEAKRQGARVSSR